MPPGVFIGYSGSFGVGNVLSKAYGYRWMFYVCAIPGAFVALLLYATVPDPKLDLEEESQRHEGRDAEHISEDVTVLDIVWFG